MHGIPWVEMQPQIEGQFEIIKFPAEGLLFLLGTKCAGMYEEYLLEEQRCRITVALIRERSKLVSEHLYPKMEQLGYKQGMGMAIDDVEKMEKALGPDLTTKLKDMTSAITKDVDLSLESLKDFYEKFQKAMEEHFPEENILTLGFKKDVI